MGEGGCGVRGARRLTAEAGSMDVDYERLSKAVAATVRALEEGSKQPMRLSRV